MSQVASSAQLHAQVGARYKSDAIDELLEDNLFKRKKSPLANTEESLLD